MNVHDFADAHSYLTWKILLRVFALCPKFRTETKLFDVTQQLTREQQLGISGVSKIELRNVYLGKAVPGSRRRSDQAHEAKVYVFSDSVLCVGNVREFPESHIG